MITFSQTVISDRLQALTRALDTDDTPGKLLIYSAPIPSPGQAAGAAIALCSLSFPKPSLSGVAGKVLTLINPAPGIVTATGVAAWARLVTGNGVYIADLDVGLPLSAAAVVLDNGADVPTLTLYAGGEITVTLATLQEL